MGAYATPYRWGTGLIGSFAIRRPDQGIDHARSRKQLGRQGGGRDNSGHRARGYRAHFPTHPRRHLPCPCAHGQTHLPWRVLLGFKQGALSLETLTPKLLSTNQRSAIRHPGGKPCRVWANPAELCLAGLTRVFGGSVSVSNGDAAVGLSHLK